RNGSRQQTVRGQNEGPQGRFRETIPRRRDHQRRSRQGLDQRIPGTQKWTGIQNDGKERSRSREKDPSAARENRRPRRQVLAPGRLAWLCLAVYSQVAISFEYDQTSHAKIDCSSSFFSNV